MGSSIVIQVRKHVDASIAIAGETVVSVILIVELSVEWGDILS